jgi:hypothetical protein
MSRVNQYVDIDAQGDGAFQATISSAQTIYIGGENSADAEVFLGNFNKTSTTADVFWFVLQNGTLTVTNATSNQVVFLNSDSSLQSIVKFRINTLDNTFQYDCDGYNCSESGGTIINGSGSTSGSGAKITTSVKYIIVSLLIR